MSLLTLRDTDEVEIIQNPALGAYCLWRFVKGYQSESSRQTPLILTFIVLPIVFHQNTEEIVQSTQKSSSLMLFATKVAKDRDNLLAIHMRANAMKGVSFRSLGLAAQTQLLKINYDDAHIWGNDARHKSQSPKLSKKVKKISDSSEKLGGWCSRLSVDQIATTLAVRF
jgi:hypothetical protein